jgi:hypothetical protein
MDVRTTQAFGPRLRRKLPRAQARSPAPQTPAGHVAGTSLHRRRLRVPAARRDLVLPVWIAGEPTGVVREVWGAALIAPLAAVEALLARRLADRALWRYALAQAAVLIVGLGAVWVGTVGGVLLAWFVVWTAFEPRVIGFVGFWWTVKRRGQAGVGLRRLDQAAQAVARSARRPADRCAWPVVIIGERAYRWRPSGARMEVRC